MIRGDGDQGPSYGCAACEFLERTCLPNCPLAPHYPPECEPQFAAVKLLLDFISPVESVLRRSNLPLLRMIQAETIAEDVASFGNYCPQAQRLLAQALFAEASKRLRQNTELRRNQTLQELIRGTRALGPGPWPTMTTTSTAVADEGSGSLGLDRLEIREEPAVRRGRRELTPAMAEAMAPVWESFVRAMELPLGLAIMELQQSGVLAYDEDNEDYVEPGPSNQDHKEEYVEPGPSDQEFKEEKEDYVEPGPSNQDFKEEYVEHGPSDQEFKEEKEDYFEPGPSDQDCKEEKEESSLGSDNVEGRNNDNDIA